MKMKIIAVLLVLGVIAGGSAAYLYRKPAETAVSGPAAYSLSATRLLNEYEQNEEQANQKYLNQVLQVTGSIGSISPADSSGVSISLETGNPMAAVSCQVADAGSAAGLRAGSTVTLKGLCTGMLMDVVLVKCTVEK